MRKSSSTILLAVISVALLLPELAGSWLAAQENIKDPAEYNSYVNAVQQSDPNAKAQAIEAFLQVYPRSVMHVYAAEQLMTAYQQAGNTQKMLDAANRLLQMDPNSVRALATLTYYYRVAITAQNLQQNLPLIQQYASRGQQALPSMPKPNGMSDADFAKMRNEFSSIFEGGSGFVALQNKSYAEAARDFRQAVSHEGQPNIMDIYPLAQAYLESNPINPDGFWFMIKAANLATGDGQRQILEYGRKKYIRYHGSEDGWTDLVNQTQASQNVMPPGGFTVLAGATATPAPTRPPQTEQASTVATQQRGVAAVPASSAPSQMQYGSYYALVIGINHYRNLPQLQTALSDADAIGKLLRDQYGFQVKVLPDPTRYQILTAVDDYRRNLSGNSSLLIYYAGHGYYDSETDKAYWLPVDAERDNHANWIIADDITSAARAVPAMHVLVVADSCYSGALTRDANIAINPSERHAYIEKMLRSKSRDLMSSGGNEPVADGGGAGKHSVFANALLQGLNGMDIDVFTAMDLFDRFVQPQVAGRSSQVPQYSLIRNSGHENGDFVFSRVQKH